MTLQDQIQLLREENSKQSEEVIGNTKGTKEGVTGLRKTMKDVLDEIRSSRLDDEEQRRDNQGGGGSGGGATPVPTQQAPAIESGGLDFLIGIPAAILAFSTGLAQSWLGGVSKITKTIGNVIKGTLKSILGGIKTILLAPVKVLASLGKQVTKYLSNFKWFQSLQTSLDSVKVFIAVFVQKIKQVGDSIKAGISSIGGQFSKVGIAIKGIFETFYIKYLIFSDKLKAFFKPVVDVFNKVVDTFKTAGKSFSAVGSATSGISSTFAKILAPIMKVVNYIRGVAPGIFKAFGALGKLFGWPLTVAIGLYEGIKNSLDSFKSGDIIGGVFKFVTGAVNGAILSLVDIFKDGISWLSEKLFGKDNPVTKFLDSFSFQELFTSFMESYETFIRELPETITNLIHDVKLWFSGLMDSEDPISYLMEPINQLIADMKDFVMGLVPDISGLVGQGVDAISSFFGGGDEETPPPPKESESKTDAPEPAPKGTKKPLEKAPELTDEKKLEKAMKLLKPGDSWDDVTGAFKRFNPETARHYEVAEDATDYWALRKAEMRLERIKNMKIDPKNSFAVASHQGTIDKQQARVDRLLGKGPVAPNIEKTTNETTLIERLSLSNRTEKGKQMQEESKENAQMKAQATSAPVNVIAPSSTTNNTTSQTAAVMDNNMSTVDNNDRSFAV